MYDQTVPQLDKMLGNLDCWLGEASEWAEQREFDADSLLHTRLFPDMFALDRQIQSACDAAKFLGARLAGVEAPSHPDTEKTLAELRERIAKVREFLQSLPREAFDDAAGKRIYVPFLQGGWVSGADYATEFALPNFYFHTTTAYALLRQVGVKLGKRAFIGGMNVQHDA